MRACTRIEGSFSTCSPAQETDGYCHDSSDQDNSAPTDRPRAAVAHSLWRFSHVCTRAPFRTLSTAFGGTYTAVVSGREEDGGEDGTGQGRHSTAYGRTLTTPVHHRRTRCGGEQRGITWEPYALTAGTLVVPPREARTPERAS